MRWIRATLGYRIHRVSQILRAVPGAAHRQASGLPWFPLVTLRKPPSVSTDRNKKAGRAGTRDSRWRIFYHICGTIRLPVRDEAVYRWQIWSSRGFRERPDLRDGCLRVFVVTLRVLLAIWHHAVHLRFTGHAGISSRCN